MLFIQENHVSPSLVFACRPGVCVPVCMLRLGRDSVVRSGGVAVPSSLTWAFQMEQLLRAALESSVFCQVRFLSEEGVWKFHESFSYWTFVLPLELGWLIISTISGPVQDS